jgi:hypothetical protein
MNLWQKSRAEFITEPKDKLRRVALLHSAIPDGYIIEVGLSKQGLQRNG